MDKLLFTCNAVLPIILCILLGYFLKRIKLLPEGFWKMGNKICFRVYLPVLLFYNIYSVDSISTIGEYWQVILFAAITTLVVFGIGLLIVIFFIKDEKQKGVVLQCIFRSNYAIIGISLVELLADGNTTAVGIAAVISAISIPLFNILAVISLSIFIKSDEEGQRVNFKIVLKRIATNPLIIAVLLGIVFLAFRELIPLNDAGVRAFTIQNQIPFLYKTIKNLAQVASPLALVCLGGGFTFKAISRLKFQIIIGVVFRTMLVPTAALIIAYLLGFRTNEFPALIALFGTPVAVASAAMAQEMNNDDELAGQLVVWTSLTSAITLFVIILICANVGIFA